MSSTPHLTVLERDSPVPSLLPFGRISSLVLMVHRRPLLCCSPDRFRLPARNWNASGTSLSLIDQEPTDHQMTILLLIQTGRCSTVLSAS